MKKLTYLLTFLVTTLTFQIIPTHAEDEIYPICETGYRIENETISYCKNGHEGEFTIEGADLATFEIFSTIHAKDKNAVYCYGNEAEKAYQGSFEPIEGTPYYADVSAVYFGCWPLHNSDPETFEKIEEGSNHYRDKNNIYYKGSVLEVDPDNFSVLGGAYATDGERVYFEDTWIRNADSQSFVLTHANTDHCGGLMTEAVDKNGYYMTGSQICSTPENDPLNVFSDLNPNTHYIDAISWTLNEGITSGYATGGWGPDECVTRAEALKMMQEYRFERSIESKANDLEEWMNFPDVSQADWHYDYVRYARFLEIVEGYPNGLFLPNQCVNRAEAMKMAINTLMPGEESNHYGELYYDDKLISDMYRSEWYMPFARTLFEKRLVGTKHTELSSQPNQTFKTIKFFPGEAMSRKEFAEMLFRIHNYQPVQSIVTQDTKNNWGNSEIDYYSVSPNGNYVVWIPMSVDEAGEVNQKIYLIDLGKKQARALAEVGPQESPNSGKGLGHFGAHAQWLNNQTLKYAVYNQSEGRNFIEYRTISVGDPAEGIYYSSASEEQFPYFYTEPESTPKGIFIYLHGAGGGYEQGMENYNYDGNFKALRNHLNEIDFIYATPATSSFGQNGGKDIEAFMHHMSLLYGYDLPIYLSGASAGGSTLFHTLNEYDLMMDDANNSNIQGAVFIVPSISEKMIDEMNWILPSSNIPVWIEAGENDAVFPPDRVHYFKEALKDSGHTVDWNIIANGDHNAPVEQADWVEILKFLRNN